MAGNNHIKEIENQEWIASLKWVIEHESKERAAELMDILHKTAAEHSVQADGEVQLVTDYINSISPDEEEDYPGDEKMEMKLYHAIRWNAMAMVARANQKTKGLGGHISTYSSASGLWEVGLNHFWHGYEDGHPDVVYFQGHASPGLYSRSYLEHRFDEENLDYFRLELQNEKGLSSYPHPRLMPDYWRFPTVSMGLAGIQAVYQARFLKYLQNREIGDPDSRPQKVWALLGDGEMDEPESTGALTIASREKLDNLIFVVNCNLQRLDGPVRGNTKVIDELESLFKGAGWQVIKLVWGRAWDKLFQKDISGKLIQKLNDMPDGELQRMAQFSPEEWREEFFTDDLAGLVENWKDEEFEGLIRGGHDFKKIYNAYLQAVENEGAPTVILAHTVKGWEQGEAGEASNVTHKTKVFNKEALKAFRDELELPIEDDELEEMPYFRYDKDSEEYQYLIDRRKDLGGTLPERKILAEKQKLPDSRIFDEFRKGTDKEVPTTGVFVKILTKLMKDEATAKSVVPIIPDESRTFGMDALFREFGIYAAEGQRYEPVDKGSLLYYKESEQGALIEEGITEAGALATFIAAGTNHISQPFYTIPFFVFYSMFGFQRVGDLIWAAADARAKGFLIGGISGRTSLSGEGLQHIDGQSHHYAMAFPNVMAYDPAFAYELAVIIQDGLKRLYEDDEDLIYYVTMGNQAYKMPSQPKDTDEGIIKGLYCFRKSRKRKNKDKKVNLLGSGSIMMEVLQAADTLEDDHDLPVDVWSATSYKALYDDARDVERENYRNGKKAKSHLEDQLSGEGEVFIAATDFIKAVPLSIAKWVPGEFIALGTDGFGRSDTVPELRNFFEVDAKHIAYHALAALANKELFKKKDLKEFASKNGIKSDKKTPADYL